MACFDVEWEGWHLNCIMDNCVDLWHDGILSYLLCHTTNERIMGFIYLFPTGNPYIQQNEMKWNKLPSSTKTISDAEHGEKTFYQFSFASLYIIVWFSALSLLNMRKKHDRCMSDFKMYWLLFQPVVTVTKMHKIITAFFVQLSPCHYHFQFHAAFRK